MTVLEISDEQRSAALEWANEIRSYRAQAKKEIKAGSLPADWFLAQGPHDDRLRSMKIRPALVAMPKIGVKLADDVLKRAGISPSKTLGGITEGQWERLYAVLEDRPAVRKQLSATGRKV